MKTSDKLFQVIHEDFHEDMLRKTVSIVKALTKKAALKKYNDEALLKKELPYLWNQVDINAVNEIDIIS